MSNLLYYVDLKLKRAKQQSDSLLDSINKWMTNNKISVRSELREGRLGFRLILNEFLEPTPFDDWGIKIGEYVHNLRSSLDNLAFALARLKKDPPGKPNDIKFPICNNEASFKKDASRFLGQLPNEAVLLIEKLQPFQRGGKPELGTIESDPLLLLQWLNNTDKHRVPSVVILQPTKLAHSFGAEFYSDEDAEANTPPDVSIYAGPIKPGIILIEYRTKNPISSVKGGGDFEGIVSLETNQTPMPINPTIPNLGYYTELVISQFRHYFRQ